MDKALDGKVAIITGGGRGMGRTIAIAYAKAGATGVVITASRSPDQLAETVAEINALTGQKTALAIQADVTDRKDCQRTVEETLAKFGAVHVLINNAARGQSEMSYGKVPFYEGDPDGWAKIVDTNINGPFNMTVAVVHPMMEQKWGRILNITKSRSSMHRPDDSPYGPSKAALEAMTLCWAQELLDTGITVNTIAPGGGVDTDFLMPADRARAATSGKPYLPPDIMVSPALWLASDEANDITGCRYIGSKWKNDLPPAEAAEACREPAIFLPPERDSLLKKTWEKPPGWEG
jgi:3-oxoacyl-[acyl-carrier protein] reductase